MADLIRLGDDAPPRLLLLHQPLSPPSVRPSIRLIAPSPACPKGTPSLPRRPSSRCPPTRPIATCEPRGQPKRGRNQGTRARAAPRSNVHARGRNDVSLPTLLQPRTRQRPNLSLRQDSSVHPSAAHWRSLTALPADWPVPRRGAIHVRRKLSFLPPSLAAKKGARHEKKIVPPGLHACQDTDREWNSLS